MPEEKRAAIYSWITQCISYDENKAKTVQSGDIPELDMILDERKGICLDFATLMTAMLRSVDVPAQLIFGWYQEDTYHAWVMVKSTEAEWTLYDPCFGAAEPGYSPLPSDYLVKNIY